MSDISVVVTVFQDRAGLEELLPALAAQTLAPDEVVVVDAGSSDGTFELLEGWRRRGLPLRVISRPGANISAGRNEGIRAARSEWIACTDAGCRPDRGWLTAIDAARDGADLVAGIYAAAGDTALERALALALYPAPDELDDPDALTGLLQRAFGRRYQASRATGRSMAFTKAAWREVGGFPEHLYAGEDVGFSTAVVRAGLNAVLAKDALVSWRPPPTLRANARMYRTYARGDVRSVNPLRHALRAGAWLGCAALVLGGGARGRLLASAGALLYLWLPLRRARRLRFPAGQWWRIPVAVAMKDLSQSAGALEGLLDAWRGARQPSAARTAQPEATSR
jgi:glycosyltransferase involved in cell wall biosynthesis